MHANRIYSRVLIVISFSLPAQAIAQPETAAQIQAKILKLEDELQRLRIEFAKASGKETNEPPILQTQMEIEFRAMLKNDRARGALEKAANLLEGNIFDEDAYGLIRTNRSLAAIPFLLKKLHERQSDLDLATLAILTGEDVAAHYKRGDPNALITNWWIPSKKTLRVDLKHMNRERLTRVVDTLLKIIDDKLTNRGLSNDITAAAVQRKLNNAKQLSSTESRGWYDEEVVSDMLPILLDRAGVRPDANAVDPRLNYTVIPLLATLRRQGEAAELDKFIRDETQPSATRLIAMRALVQAGEDLPTAFVLDLYKQAKSLEVRVAAILTLPWSDDPQRGSEQLVAALDDPNIHIRAAAVLSLGSIAAPAAVPKLIKMLDDQTRDEKRPQELVRYSEGNPGTVNILRALAESGSREATQHLVARLEMLMDQNAEKSVMRDTLQAFESLTGMVWIRPGAEASQYRFAAAQAIEWWRGQQRKKP